MHLALMVGVPLGVSLQPRDAAHASSLIVEAGLTCQVEALPGLFAQLRRVSRETGVDPATVNASGVGPAQAGRLTDFWQIAFAVLGVREHQHEATDNRSVSDRVGLPSLDRLPCDAAIRARDRAAWSMGLVGYSAREIADVLAGHLARADLDEALSRAMAGEPKAKVAAFLDSRWREPELGVAVQPAATPSTGTLSMIEALDGEIIALAREHRV